MTDDQILNRPALRALRRHHRARLIRRVGSYGDGFREHAVKVYNNRKICTCHVSFCGNPRRLLRGSRRKQLTVQERRQLQPEPDIEPRSGSEE